MSLSTNTSRKKSKASSVQPRKLAATTCLWALVQPESAEMADDAGCDGDGAGMAIAEIRQVKTITAHNARAGRCFRSQRAFSSGLRVADLRGACSGEPNS